MRPSRNPSAPRIKTGDFVLVYTELNGQQKKYFICYVAKLTHTVLQLVTVDRNILRVRTKLHLVNQWDMKHLFDAYKAFYQAEDSVMAQGMIQPTTLADFLFAPQYISTYDTVFVSTYSWINKLYIVEIIPIVFTRSQSH